LPKAPPPFLRKTQNILDTQISPGFINWAATVMYIQACATGAGNGEYVDFILFDIVIIEMYKIIGLLFGKATIQVLVLCAQPGAIDWENTYQQCPM
jgi:hypothetical protein